MCLKGSFASHLSSFRLGLNLHSIFGGANSGASPGRRGLASAPKSPVMQGMSSPKPRVDFSAELQQYLSNDVLTTYVRYFGGFYDTAASSLTITPPLLGQGGNKSVQQVPATLQSLAPSSSSLAAAMPLGSLSTDATPRSGSAGSSSSPVASSSSVASISSWIHNLLIEGIDGAIEFLDNAHGMIWISDGLHFHSCALGHVPSLRKILRPGMTLCRISLRHCCLTSLEPFAYCATLEEMNVSDNRLTIIPWNLLNNLRQLKTLHADYNRIDLIELRHLDSEESSSSSGYDGGRGEICPQLLKLTLAHNQLEAPTAMAIVTTRQFAPLLDYVDMSFNVSIVDFPVDFLRYKPWLRSVSLIGNNRMPPPLARKLESLRCATLDMFPPVVFCREVRVAAGESPPLTFKMAQKYWFVVQMFARIFLKVRMERTLRSLLLADTPPLSSC